MRLHLLALASASFSLAAVAQYPGSEPPPADYKPGWDTINLSDAKTWLGYLAGPECMGRGTGQPGYMKAAEFMAERFKAFGLKPIGDNGTYFQAVPFQKSVVDPATSYLEVEGRSLKLEVGKGIAFPGATGDAEASGGVVFVKATGDADLADPETVKDRFVILVGGNAGQKLRTQLRQQGARLVRVVDVLPESGTTQPKSENRRPQGGARTLSSAVLTKSAANELATTMGVDLTKLVPTGDQATAVAPATGTINMVAKVSWKDTTVPNVVAAIEGSDPVLKNEVVGLGAHLDHLGESGGQVYWGADDDASGNTALLLIARAMAANPVKPKRTILFMAFTGEEMGLIGSRYYAANPIYPLDKMSCLLQMDMIGRNEEKGDEKAEDNIDTIHLVGSKRISTELHEAVIAANKHVNLKFEYDEEGVYTRSDHYSFASKGVPAAFIFSGFHPDYHQPTDTVDKINFEKVLNASRLFYLVAFDAANRPEAYRREVTDKSGG